MSKLNFFFFLISFCFVFIGNAQEYNNLDGNNKKHGNWQKVYEGTNQLRYEGTFDHGQEIGTFKFYDRKGGHPTALKIYTAGDAFLDVIFYTTEGKKVSEGKMKERSREGKWIYYHQDGTTVMTEEFYKNDLLDGMRTVYFESGAVAQRMEYVNGKANGIETHYSEEGVVVKTYTHVNGELHGPVKLYNLEGVILREGNYKNNQKHGVWKYYKNGQLDKTLTFPLNKIGVH
ncbi:toxin-antitoxin system YwqK family antitoxin [Dokdonia ponticola]|uniref:Toxin-antitoxin system YwqK family antitoxin n=1 Tax=Dokdonia ponticola TaxID=2041041 RepID=A0ABV9HY44_9FLAO